MRATHVAGLATLLLVLTSCASTRVNSDYDARTDFRSLRTYTWIDADLSQSAYPGIQNPFVQERIQNAVDAELAGRGFRRITSGTPDFRIAFQIVANKSVAGSNLKSIPRPATGREQDVSNHNGDASRATALQAGYYGHTYRGYRRGYTRLRHGYGHGYGRGYGYGNGRGYGYGYGYGRHGYGYGYSLNSSQADIKSTIVLDLYDGSNNKLLWRGWASKDLTVDPNPEEVQKYVRDAVREILKEFPPEQ